jgi:hypothetical protein
MWLGPPFIHNTMQEVAIGGPLADWTEASAIDARLDHSLSPTALAKLALMSRRRVVVRPWFLRDDG